MYKEKKMIFVGLLLVILIGTGIASAENNPIGDNGNYRLLQGILTVIGAIVVLIMVFRVIKKTLHVLIIISIIILAILGFFHYILQIF